MLTQEAVERPLAKSTLYADKVRTVLLACITEHVTFSVLKGKLS